MASRRSGGNGNGNAAPPSTAPWPLDWQRQHLAARARGACALFRGFESMRRIQMKAARQAVAHHEAAAGRLEEPCSPLELMAVQAELLRSDLQGAALYWQQIGAAVLDMQREWLGGAAQAAQHDMEQAGEHAVPPMTGMNPFFFAPPFAATHH